MIQVFGENDEALHGVHGGDLGYIEIRGWRFIRLLNRGLREGSFVPLRS